MMVLSNPLKELNSKRRLSELLLMKHSISGLKKLGDDNNYKVFYQEKLNSFGQIRRREIHEPKLVLKRIHSRLNKLLTRRLFPYYLHSGIKKRSYKTNAEVHKGAKYLVNIDIRSYYDSCTIDKVYKFFKDDLNQSSDVAHILSKITTFKGHVPTGSPVSQILAYLCSSDMFSEIESYCSRFQVKFTIYVDDITFSSKKNISTSFINEVIKIIRKHGFDINKKKLKKYNSSSVKEVTGVMIRDEALYVPNKRKKKIFDLIEQKGCDRRVFGRLTEVAHIEGEFSLKTLRKEYQKRLAS